MGLDPDFFESLNAVQVPEFSICISDNIKDNLQQHLNPSSYPVSKCDELYLSVRMFLHEAPAPSP